MASDKKRPLKFKPEDEVSDPERANVSRRADEVIASDEEDDDSGTDIEDSHCDENGHCSHNAGQKSHLVGNVKDDVSR